MDLPVQLREVSPFGLEATLPGAAWEPRPQGLGEQSVRTREMSQRESHMLCFPRKTGVERERIREQSLRVPVAASNLRKWFHSVCFQYTVLPGAGYTGVSVFAHGTGKSGSGLIKKTRPVALVGSTPPPVLCLARVVLFPASHGATWV